ncbi:MAG: hypothetical protein J3Q66DRAFT_359408, partial [Benniella sp.]
MIIMAVHSPGSFRRLVVYRLCVCWLSSYPSHIKMNLRCILSSLICGSVNSIFLSCLAIMSCSGLSIAGKL